MSRRNNMKKRPSSTRKQYGKSRTNPASSAPTTSTHRDVTMEKDGPIMVSATNGDSSSISSSTIHRRIALVVLMLSIAFHNLPISSWLPSWNTASTRTPHTHEETDSSTTAMPTMRQSSPQEKIKVFLSWLRENGANISNSVTLSSFPEFGGYGLVAFRNEVHDEGKESKNQHHSSSSSSIAIHEMEELFTIPSNIIITTRNILEEYHADGTRGTSSTVQIPNLQQRLSLIFKSSNVHSTMVQQDIMIGLYLLQQDKLGPKSLFRPYLDILPTTTLPRLDTFVDSEEALELLNDVDLVALAKESYHHLTLVWNNVDFQQIVSSLLQEASGVTLSSAQVGGGGVDIDASLSPASFEDFHKFVSIVSSRAMVLHGTKYLTPLAGMANYKPRKIGKARKDEPVKPFTLYHERSTINHSITVRADRHVKFGHQIFEDYGELDNSLYLEAHGFVPEENPYHCATIQGQYLPSTGNLSDSLIQILIRLRVLPQSASTGTGRQLHNVSPPPSICVREDGSILDERAKVYLKVAALDVMGNDHLLQMCLDTLNNDNDVELMALQCIHYPGNELAFDAMIKSSARKAICTSPNSSTNSSTIEKDIVLLASYLSQERILPLKERAHATKKRLAIQFRLSDKKILWNLGELKAFDCSIEYNAFKSVLDPSFVCPSSHIDPVTKVTKTSHLHAQSLTMFDSYVNTLDIKIQKIKAEYIGNGMRIGVVATQDIEHGEAYFSINSASVIDSDTIILEETLRESINKLLMRFKRQNDGGFKAMLWFLMYEAFVMKEKSPWHPYLKLLPTIEELRVSSPLFFDESALVYLAGSDLRNAILQNQRTALDAMELAFSDTDVMNVFKSRIITRENFLWAHHILDSR